MTNDMNAFLSEHPVSPYGVMVAVSLLIWLLLSLRYASLFKKRRNSSVSVSGILTLFALSLPVGLVFSRLLWCISNYHVYLADPSSIFKIWEGGLSLWGLILGFWLTVRTSCKHISASSARSLDTFSAGLILFIAVLRISEVFTGQGIGRIITYEFLVNPIISVRDSHDEARFAVYRLEAAYALLLFIIVLFRSKKYARAKKAVWGDLWRFSVGGYAMAQIVFESMREDDFMHFGFVRVSQVLSILILLVYAFYYVYRLKKAHLLRAHALWMIPLALAATAFVILEEFRVDSALNTEKEHFFMLIGAFFLYLPSVFSMNRLLKHKKANKTR